MAYSTLNVENCRNLGASLGYFLGTVILMNYLTFTRIGQSFGWEYFRKSSSKSKIYSYKNLQRRWCNFLFGWYFSICQWRFIAEQDTEPLRVRYWESEWLNEWVGEEAPSRISCCLPTQFTLDLKRRTRYEADRFFFINEGNFRDDEGYYTTRPTLSGEFLFPGQLPCLFWIALIHLFRQVGSVDDVRSQGSETQVNHFQDVHQKHKIA